MTELPLDGGGARGLGRLGVGISPHISPYLPISRCRLGVGAQLAETLERFLQRRQDVRLQRLRRRRRCLGVRRQTREPALGKRKLQPRDLVGRAVVHHRNY